MFAIVINSSHSRGKKWLHLLVIFFPRERVETSQTGVIKQNLSFFQWIYFSQGSVPILQMQVVHITCYCMCRMVQRTVGEQGVILVFSKDHRSMLRSSTIVNDY